MEDNVGWSLVTMEDDDDDDVRTLLLIPPQHRSVFTIAVILRPYVAARWRHVKASISRDTARVINIEYV